MHFFDDEVNGLKSFMISYYMKTTILTLVLYLFLISCGNDNDNNTTSFKSLKLFPEGKSFSGFQLTSNHGKTWHADDFKGNYSIVFFGYTNCPDICPTTLLDMQKIDKQLKTSKIPRPNFVFISVDPDRDTPDVLNDYINYFNPEFKALTGDQANILSIASQLGVAYHVADHEKDDLVYDVDHASALFVINPQGERIGIFSAPHDVNVLIADIKLLMENS